MPPPFIINATKLRALGVDDSPLARWERTKFRLRYSIAAHWVEANCAACNARIELRPSSIGEAQIAIGQCPLCKTVYWSDTKPTVEYNPATMCGRYTIRRFDPRIYGLVDVPLPAPLPSEPNLFNIAPSQYAPIIRIDKNGSRVVSMVRWGLIPHWTKGKPKVQPINAKSETAATSAMFRGAMERRRCLIPADGFYEWQGDKPPKQPYFIHLKSDGQFAFAGLWERWRETPDSEPIDTFTILTTETNDLLRPIHQRMPVILEQSAFDKWLNRDNKAADVADLLKPYDPEKMEAYKVSGRVNKPANDGKDLIEPVADDKQ